MKVPQKIQVANYVLALSHDLSTGVTTALINGYCAMTMRKYLTDEIRNFVGNEHSNQSYHILSQIQANPLSWTHPMLLPTILLETHMQRAQNFARNLEDQVMGIERSTGVVFAGRLGGQAKPPPKEHTRRNTQKLTQDMHTTLSDIIMFSTSTTWDLDFAPVLLKWCKDVADVIPQTRWHSTIQGTRALCEVLEHMVGMSKSMCDFITTLKEKVQSQVTVVRHFNKVQYSGPSEFAPFPLKGLLDYKE